MQGDSGLSSISLSSGSVTEVAARTIRGTDSLDPAPRDRLRQQGRGHRFSPREGWSSRQQQIVRKIRRHYKHKGHEASSYQQRSLHEEQLVYQQRDAQRNLRAELSMLAAQSSTQLNAGCHMVEYDSSVEKDELHRIQMEEFGRRGSQFKLRRQLMSKTTLRSGKLG